MMDQSKSIAAGRASDNVAAGHAAETKAAAYFTENIEVSTFNHASLIERLPKMFGKKIMVVGDIGLDEYLLGDVRRISPEAPVPILDVSEQDQRLGLAANVALNLQTLKGIPYMVSVVGKDVGSDMLKELCQRNKVSFDHVVVDDHRPTTRKTRVMAGPHHIVRVDYELRKYITELTENKILKKCQELIAEMDGVIIEDYAKGVITETLVQKIVQLSRTHNKPIFVDPTRSKQASFYENVDVIKPNYEEALELSGLKFEDLKENPNKIYEVGHQIQLKSKSKNVVITRGPLGMTIFSGNQVSQVKTMAKKVFDVTGAGDTVIATLALAQTAGFSLIDSCMLGNHAAGIVVGKIGCVPCEIEELKQSLSEYL
ncbi:MAG: D-glycero-beta-D-manno-heptose-7-phosphate kinase [Pseudobdellovibrionaceae bacterium]